MKEDIITKLQHVAHRDIASATWLARTKRILLAYMHAHPKQPRASFASWFSSRLLVRASSILAVLVLMLTGVAGVTFASQESIPGDALYSWKVGVEDLQSVFLVSTQSRADFEVQRTTKRLQEVTELAVRKPTDTTLSHEAHDRLQAQIEVASAEIARVAMENPRKALEAAVTLQSTLQAHKEVLDQLAPKVAGDTKPQIQDALDAIKKNSDQVGTSIQDLRIKTQDDLIAARATETIKTDAAAKLDEVKKNIDDVWNRISLLPDGSALRDEAESKVAGAQDALSDAQDAFSKGSYADTLIALQSSTQLLSETTAILDVNQNAGIAVKIALISPTPTATPIPTPLTPIFSVALNKSTYLPTETIIITIKATNLNNAPLTFNWNNGCQVDAVIDDYPTLQGHPCTAAPTSVTIPGQQSYPWVLTLTAPIDIGTHVIHAEVFGYGKAQATLKVEEK